MQVIEEVYWIVLELDIQAEELVEAHVRKLAIGVHDAREEMDRVQLELIL